MIRPVARPFERVEEAGRWGAEAGPGRRRFGGGGGRSSPGAREAFSSAVQPAIQARPVAGRYDDLCGRSGGDERSHLRVGFTTQVAHRTRAVPAAKLSQP